MYCTFLLSPSLSPITCSGEAGSHVTKTVMEKPHGEEQRSLITVMWMSSEVDIMALVNPWMIDCRPWMQPCERFWRKTTQWSAPEFLTHRNYETTNVCCFEPLSFGVICCLAIGKSYSYCSKEPKKKKYRSSENLDYFYSVHEYSKNRVVLLHKAIRDLASFLLLLATVLRCIPFSNGRSWLTSFLYSNVSYVPTPREVVIEWKDRFLL